MNGASSSGKSTFGRLLRSSLSLPYFYLSSDQLVDAGVLPRVDRENLGNLDSWDEIRPKFFDAFHRSVAVFADAGNLVIVEHIVESQSWFHELVELLRAHAVLYVGVHCPVEELDRRERARGNRRLGEARSHLDDIHTWSAYDVEIDTFQQTPQENVESVVAAMSSYDWKESVFQTRLRQ